MTKTSPTAVDEHALKGHIQRLAGDIGERHVFRPHALAAAADFIGACWRDQGYQVVPQEYEVRGVRCLNLEATRRGTSRPDQIVLVGAHYDTVAGSPGANDNASGVAAMLELSRLFASIAPAMTVRFVAFVNEEWPFFRTRRQGSMVYAAAARARNDDIRLMLSLETLGYYRTESGSQRYPPLFRLFYPDRGDFLALVSNLRSRPAMQQLARAYRAVSDYPLEHVATLAVVPGVSWSDHRSFWKHGYRAVMVTDTAFYRYPHYHAAEDTPDKLTYAAFAAATEGLFRALVSISSH